MIEVKISAATPVEAAQQFRDFADLINLPNVEVEKVTNQKAATGASVSKAEGKAKTAKVDKVKVEKSNSEETGSGSEITLDDLKEKATQLKKEQGRAAVRAILDEFETERVSTVKKEQYEEFLAALEEALDA